MNKIISFSLWGSVPKYNIGAIENKNIAKEIYPGWTCRYYIGQSVPRKTREALVDDNTELIFMDEIGDWKGMFWRFFAVDNEDGVVLSRDVDSRLNMREKLAVDEWLESKKDFHIMRDHPQHGTVILGGMWGVRNGLLKGIKKEIEEYKPGSFYQVDQNFLREVIYNKVKNTLFVHDEFFNFNKDRHKFPQQRVNQEFVGDVFDEHNVRHPEYYKEIK